MIAVPTTEPGAADDLPHVGGDAGLAHQLDAREGDQRALAVGLVHHGIAGRDRRDAVGDRHRERVVPRADDADDTLGHLVDRDRGQARQRAVAAARADLLLEPPGVEARRQGQVGDLVERVRAALAGLDLDQVEQLVLVLEDEVVQPQQRLLAGSQRGLRPRLLRHPGGRERLVDVGDARHRDVGDRLAGQRRVGRPVLTRGRTDEARQLRSACRRDGRRGRGG